MEDVVANATKNRDGRIPATIDDGVGDVAESRDAGRDIDNLDCDSLADPFEWGGGRTEAYMAGDDGNAIARMAMADDDDGGDDDNSRHRHGRACTNYGTDPDGYGGRKKQPPDEHDGRLEFGGGEYCLDRHGQKQPQPSTFVTAPTASMPPPISVATTVMTPTRINAPSRTAIEASHVEDVLTMSLELERVRSQLASALRQLSDATSLGDELRTRNDKLQRESTELHSRFEWEIERSAAELSSLRRQLQAERVKSKAAEDDATLALELAKESQSNREECEMWLSRSLEEMDLWKSRYMELMEERRRGGDDADGGGWGQSLDGPSKNVRFKDEDGAEEEEYEDEGCPPSPVKSVLGFDDDGYFGNDDHDVSHQRGATSSTPSRPPPPPPPIRPADASSSLLTPRHVATTNGDGAAGKIFSPAMASHATTSPDHLDGDFATPLSKSTAIASGRAVLHRAAASSSSSSPSPLGEGVVLSPHPRKQAQDLLKKSAETRRLLRERLTPRRRHVFGGGSGVIASIENGRNAKQIDGGSSLKDDSFASRQGAACRAVGRAIRESGARLKLKSIWWSSHPSRLENISLVGNDDNHVDDSATMQETHGNDEDGHGTLAQLESMVRDYCGSVEATIGRQRTRIDELLAFCDHLEKKVTVVPC
jgi:hypothetical protein